MKRVDKQRPDPIRCAVCGKACPSRYSFNQHVCVVPDRTDTGAHTDNLPRTVPVSRGIVRTYDRGADVMLPVTALERAGIAKVIYR